MSREIQQKPEKKQSNYKPFSHKGLRRKRPPLFSVACQPLKLKTTARLIDKSDNVQKTERPQTRVVLLRAYCTPLLRGSAASY
jgi:hypothetical protein